MMLLRQILLVASCTCFSTNALSQADLSTIRQWREDGQFCELAQMVLRSDNPEKRLLKAEALLRLNKLDEARQLLNKELPTPQHNAQRQLLLARLAQASENWSLADSLFQKLHTNKALPEGVALGYYGIFLFDAEHFQEAQTKLEQALSTLDSDNELRAISHKFLGNTYLRYSKNEAAKAEMEKALSWWEVHERLSHPDYGELLNDLAILAMQNNNLAKAEDLLLASKDVHKPCTLPIMALYNTSVEIALYRAYGDFERSLSVVKRYLKDSNVAFFKKEKTFFYLEAGSLYDDIYQDSLDITLEYYEKAEALIQEISQELYLPFSRANVIGEVAKLADYFRDDERADQLYQLQLSILEEALDTENTSYSIAANNYAYFLALNRAYNEAESYYLKSLDIVQSIYGARHPEVLTTEYNIANLYFAKGDTTKALNLFLETNQKQLDLLGLQFADFDERARLQARLVALGHFDLFFNFTLATQIPAAVSQMQSISLGTKNLALDYSLQAQHFLAEANLTDTQKELYQDWRITRSLLAQAYSMTANDRSFNQINLDSLQKRSEFLERSLIQSLPPAFAKTRRPNYQEMCRELAENEALIDIMAFETADIEGPFPDSFQYVALIGRSGDLMPTFVHLGTSHQLDKLLDRSSHYTENVRTGHELFKLIWEPLEPYLKDVRDIHISPDGRLLQVAYEGLYDQPGNPTHTLSDDYSFFYHSNLSDFRSDNTEQFSRPASALIVGNPPFSPSDKQWQYWFDTTEEIPEDAKTNQRPFQNLPGTQFEADTLEGLFQRNGLQTNSLVQDNATEQAFIKRLKENKSPDIIHVATHGYFLTKNLNANTDSKLMADRFASSENPMVRSGLIMAGGNFAWNGGSIPPTKKDGVLTAEEIRNLQLPETQLVVLSACETGRGSIAHGEGVFGLQRAFQSAGANQFIISLWKVPDQQTSELMAAFYLALMDGKSPSQALRQAQREMKERYTYPYYWSGFVLYQ